MRDYTGQKFGRLTAVRFVDSVRYGKKRQLNHRWEFLCDCGKTIKVFVHSVKRGCTKFCGCLMWDINHRRVRLTQHQNYIKYRSKRLESVRIYRLTHKAQIQEYFRRKSDYYRIKAAERRARKKALTINPQSILEWVKSLKRKRTFVCHWCRERFPVKELTVDHVIPLVQNGIH